MNIKAIGAHIRVGIGANRGAMHMGGQRTHSARHTEEGGTVQIKKRPSRPKYMYPSERKHGNIPRGASDYCLSYIGLNRSLKYLSVDLAFDAAVPARRCAIAIATVARTCHVPLTVGDAGRRAPSADFVLRG